MTEVKLVHVGRSAAMMAFLEQSSQTFAMSFAMMEWLRKHRETVCEQVANRFTSVKDVLAKALEEGEGESKILNLFETMPDEELETCVMEILASSSAGLASLYVDAIDGNVRVLDE